MAKRSTALKRQNTMSAPADTAPDLVLPGLDVRALARRAAVPAALALTAGLALVIAGGPLRAFAHAFSRAVAADPRWVIAAAAFELLSFAGYIALLWLAGSRATSRMGLRASAQVALGGAAATRLLPTAGVGGAALTLWALRRTGLGTRGATRTLFAFLVVLYAVFLTSIAVAGGLLATGLAHGHGPAALSALPAAGATLAMVTALALGALAPRAAARAAAPTTSRVWARVTDSAAVFGAGVRDALSLVRSADPRLLGALAWWAFDAAVLWAMLHAFGAPPSLIVVVLAYFVGQVGNTIPIPGAVSGGIVGVLVAFDVPADLALVSVLAYRSVAIWLPAPIGLAALRPLQRTVARWKSEDDPQPATLVVVPPGPTQTVSMPVPVLGQREIAQAA
jgi:putative heme transporter